MNPIRLVASFGLGGSRHQTEETPSGNHFAPEKLSKDLQKKIASMELVRVAGNVYECPSTKDFWQVQGNKIVRMSGGEVDNGERIAAAPADHPADFLTEVLADLEF